MQCLFVAIGFAKAHISLSFRPVAFLVLQSGRQGSIHHLAQRSHVVAANPLPLLQLFRQQDGLFVKQLYDGFYLEFRLSVVHADYNTGVSLRLVEWHDDAHAGLGPCRQLIADGIGEHPVEG